MTSSSIETDKQKEAEGLNPQVVMEDKRKRWKNKSFTSTTTTVLIRMSRKMMMKRRRRQSKQFDEDDDVENKKKKNLILQGIQSRLNNKKQV